MYFIKYNSANNLTHAGTGKTVIAAFDYRNIRKSIRVYLESLSCDVDNQKPIEKEEDMSEQICDICKKEPARVFIKGQGKYCLKCYNTMALERSGTDDTYQYPETVAVREGDGKLHIFHIEHMVMGDTVSWEAFEQKGNYHFRDISDIAMNGALAAQKFFRKIVEGVCTKSLIEDDFHADNLLHRDGKYLSLHDKGTINIIADEDRDYQVAFEIDGLKFSGEDLEKLLGPFPGFSMRYQIQDASDPILKEDEYLVPVYITKACRYC